MVTDLGSMENHKTGICIKNGTIVNVLTGELVPGQYIVIWGDTVRSMGTDPGPLAETCTEHLDAAGALVVPGLIDAHTHLDSLVRIDEYARYLLPTGCTTMITEMAMAANAAGPEALRWFMESGRDLPLRVFYLVPPMVPSFPEFESAHDFPEEAYERLLREPEVVGVGEAYWPMIIKPNERVLRLWNLARIRGKTREGHTAGARGDKLTTYLYRGATSCHESITWQEALEKIRQGYTVMIREGFVRKDLQAVAPVCRNIRDFRNLILVSDTFAPEDLVKGNGLHSIVQKAIKHGFDPIVAIQMASLNPATYFNLRDMGAVAVGRKADLFLANGFENLTPQLVMVGGRVVARNGKLTVPLPMFSYPPPAYSSIALRPINEALVRPPVVTSDGRIRVVSIVNETVTQELNVILPTSNGIPVSDLQQDVVKMAVFNRQKHVPTGSVGFVHGSGLKEGAVATSMIWDTANVLVIGATDAEMVTAVNRLLHNGGGWVVGRGKKILSEITLPIFGLINDMTLPQLVGHLQEFESSLRHLGVLLKRPFLTLQTLSFTGLPFLRLTDRGLVDVRLGKFVSLSI
jgi:adenine deaminase